MNDDDKKMKIEIKNRDTNDVIFAFDCENNTIKKTVEEAVRLKINLTEANLSRTNLRVANLSWADLSGADLVGAYLSGAYLMGAYLSRTYLSVADLRGVLGNMKEICSMQIEQYPITFTNEVLQIGCKKFTHQEWLNFDDETIFKMDGKEALLFWNKYKDFIFKAIELRYGIIYE